MTISSKVKSPPSNRSQPQERRQVQVVHQPNTSNGNAKYVKIEYQQQDKGIVYDIQGKAEIQLKKRVNLPDMEDSFTSVDESFSIG